MTSGELTDLIEVLAAIEHKRWADWQRYVHGEGTLAENGDLIIPAQLVSGWERQIATSYSELTEAEKESDRKQVREYLPIVLEHLRKIK